MALVPVVDPAEDVGPNERVRAQHAQRIRGIQRAAQDLLAGDLAVEGFHDLLMRGIMGASLSIYLHALFQVTHPFVEC